MLLYLFNMSCIWILCLFAFHTMLRRESFHSFNRYFLIGTMLSGCIIPLITWGTGITAYSTAPARPFIVRTIQAKQHVVNVIQPGPSFDWISLLQQLYMVGVLIALLLLIKEVVSIIRLYSKGTKTRQRRYTLVETHQQQSPFSIFRVVFISSRNSYSADELNMIIAHELRHADLRHSIDLIVLRLMQVIFWFHPLVYVFGRKLLLVHEYQADSPTGNAIPAVYGRFLIEQSLLAKAPVLSHSFSQFSIKNRITMLKKTSSGNAKLKALITIPLIAVSVILFSNCNKRNTAAKDSIIIREGNTVYFKGNKIELKTGKTDTFIYTNPSTGKVTMETHNWADEPIRINGAHIYSIYNEAYTTDVDLDTDPVFSLEGKQPGDYLFDELKDEFEKLEDGTYNLLFANMVVDEKGSLVFYDYSGIQKVGEESQGGGTIISKLDDKLKMALYNCPKFTPATVNGKAVPATFHGVFNDRQGTVVVVQNHKASLSWRKS